MTNIPKKKTKYWKIDYNDGLHYCISGDKKFYLQSADDEILQILEGMKEEMEKDWKESTEDKLRRVRYGGKIDAIQQAISKIRDGNK